jgi:hypothetical protein
MSCALGIQLDGTCSQPIVAWAVSQPVIPDDSTTPTSVFDITSTLTSDTPATAAETSFAQVPELEISTTSTQTSQYPTIFPSEPTEPVHITEKASNDGVSKGAVAGIAIATCVLGAAIASLIAFLLFKKRNRKGKPGLTSSSSRYMSYADSSPELIVESKNAMQSPYTRVLQAPVPGPVPESVHPTPTPDTLLAFLPIVADSSIVQSRVLALFDQIYHHVDVYYRDVHASITPSMEPNLAHFSTQDVNMAELLQICARPTVALKHALGTWVLGITGPKGGYQEDTVFPEQLQRDRGDRPSAKGMLLMAFSWFCAGLIEPTDDSDLSTAKSLHRQLTAYIYTSSLPSHLPHSSSRASLVPQTSATMREAAEHFSLTFFPWGDPSSRDVEREDDLLRILSEALELQVWLFGQPDEWVFEWTAADRGVVVRPGLQRTNERGNTKVVLERDVVAI